MKTRVAPSRRMIHAALTAAMLLALGAQAIPAEAGRVVITKRRNHSRTTVVVKKRTVVKRTVVKRTVVVRPSPVVVKKTVVVRPTPVVVQKTVAVRPWYSGAQKILFRSSPYYFHASLGVYFGGASLSLAVGDVAPLGYIYYHPYSGRRFRTVAGFKAYCSLHPRQPRVLTVVAI